MIGRLCMSVSALAATVVSAACLCLDPRSEAVWVWLAIGALLLALVELIDRREEVARLRRSLADADWNLAGCELVAKGHVAPGAYNRLMAGPALRAVSGLAAKKGAK